MDKNSELQGRKRMVARALVVICLLIVFAWFMVPDAGEWAHYGSNPSGKSIGVPSATLPSQADTFDYSKYETPPFNPNDDNTSSCSNSKNRSLEEYALMIDAGSTGSRIHVYQFSNCNDVPELLNEVFQQTTPGLSSYGDNPSAAAASLDVLMEVAMGEVPKNLQRCTPIAVKATAGLRLLGAEKSQLILDAVRTRLETKYPFPLAGEDAVMVMDGRDEGVYAWITVNYLLGKLGGNPDSSDQPSTVAVFDLGGASTQIVFEPNFELAHGKGHKEKLSQGEHRYLLTFAGHTYELYQHSYLGYGLMEARKKIVGHVALNAQSNDNDDDDVTETKADISVNHPCVSSNHSELFKLDETHHVKLLGEPDAPSLAQCLNLAEKILEKDADCLLLPCSFAGIYQPSLAQTFAHEEIYAFSYFYDRTAPIGMPSEFTLHDLRDLTRQVCSTHPHQHFAHLDSESLKELTSEPLWCMDLSFIYSLLRFGYDIPEERTIRVAKKVRGAETGWCLGAAITMLDEANFCEM